jgi:hypothetical protein
LGRRLTEVYGGRKIWGDGRVVTRAADRGS